MVLKAGTEERWLGPIRRNILDGLPADWSGELRKKVSDEATRKCDEAIEAINHDYLPQERLDFYENIFVQGRKRDRAMVEAWDTFNRLKGVGKIFEYEWALALAEKNISDETANQVLEVLKKTVEIFRRPIEPKKTKGEVNRGPARDTYFDVHVGKTLRNAGLNRRDTAGILARLRIHLKLERRNSNQKTLLRKITARLANHGL